MQFFKKKRTLLATALVASSVSAVAVENPLAAYQEFLAAVDKTSNLTRSKEVHGLLNKHEGLNITKVTWEDTGRAQGSSYGPNISDMFLQVHTAADDGSIKPVSMPVVRYNNFKDPTTDTPIANFKLLVGNEKGKELKSVSLQDYLSDLNKYLTVPAKEQINLLSARDTHVLVSPQISLLPVPQGQKVDFNVVLFNYQSWYDKEERASHPAVLTILATKDGTSATIIDNNRHKFKNGGNGQRLFFNKNGVAHSLDAGRKSDLTSAVDNVTVDNSGFSASGNSGANVVMMIQVPLEVKENPNRGFGGIMFESMARSLTTAASRPDIEDAVVGIGKKHGKYVELDGVQIKRDERFPIRVTTQFYKATSDGLLDDKTVIDFRKQLNKVLQDGDYFGSLVTNGFTGRPTEHKYHYCQNVPFYRHRTFKITLGNGDEVSISKKFITKYMPHYWGPNWQRWCKWGEVPFYKALITTYSRVNGIPLD